MRTLGAKAFKAQCLAILDEVDRTGESVVILKRGRPVAKLARAASANGRYPQECLRGSVEVLGDIMAPVLPAHAWEALAGGRKKP
jgi:antitoxin (DNA-binding transcriptional repressor) of toxin-antitoxin stability system